mgnify:CR=1 FL=1
MEITALTALELGKKIKAGEVTVEEAVKAQLEKIKERDSVYNCYVTVMEEEALKRAAEVQKQIDAGELKDSPLAGVPVAIKDNICTKGVLTTCSSKILNNFKPPYDATVMRNWKRQGLLLLVRLIWMSLPWEVQQRPLILVRQRIHGIRNVYRVVLQAVWLQL